MKQEERKIFRKILRENKWTLSIITILIILLLASMISASPGTYKQNTNITLIQTCDDCTFNNITTIVLGNKTVLNINEAMTQGSGNVYSWILISNHTSSLGIYTINGIGDDSSGANWVYTIEVTPSGKSTTTGNSLLLILSIGFFLILGILSFFGFYKSSGNLGISLPVRWTFFIFGFIFFLTSINLISATIPDALVNENVVGFFDFFASVSFLLFWFAFGLLAIMWFLTFFQTILIKKNQRNFQKYG